MSIFESNIFEGHRVGYGMLGEVPAGAAPLASLNAYRTRFPTLPSDESLRGKGMTHFTTRARPDGISQDFTFYGESDEELGPVTVYHAGAGPVAPEPGGPKSEQEPLPARREGDGLLPSSTRPTSTPKWVPVVAVGGGVVALAVVAWAVFGRKPRAVAANRRRRRRSRRPR